MIDDWKKFGVFIMVDDADANADAYDDAADEFSWNWFENME